METMIDGKHHPPYREEKTELAFEDITSTKLEYNTIDITYRSSKHTTKTVRSVGAHAPATYNRNPDGYYNFYDNGNELAFNPETTTLISINRNGQNTTLAEKDDIVKIEEITFKHRAKVTGAQQENVTADVYYRSNRSDTIKQIQVEVERIENAVRMSGKDVDNDRRVEFYVKHERDIVSKQGTKEYTLGKVTRVEFPLGHEFTVQLEGLEDTQITDDFIESLKNGIQKATRHKDVEKIRIEHNGRIKNED